MVVANVLLGIVVSGGCWLGFGCKGELGSGSHRPCRSRCNKLYVCVCGSTNRQHTSMCAVEPADLLMTYFCNATTGCATLGIHKAGKRQLQHHLNTKAPRQQNQCMYVSALQANNRGSPHSVPLFPTPGQHCVARCHPQPPDTSTCRLACRHGTVVEATHDGCKREKQHNKHKRISVCC